MTLTSLYSQSRTNKKTDFFQQNQSTLQNDSYGKSFDSYLENANDADKKQLEVKEKPKKSAVRTDKKQTLDSNNKEKVDHESKLSDETKSSEADKVNEKTDTQAKKTDNIDSSEKVNNESAETDNNTVETDAAETEVPIDTTKVADEIMSVLAAELNLPIEEIAAAFEALDISPLELGNSEKAIKVAMELLGLESKADLLTADNANEMITSIMNTAEQFEAVLQNVVVEKPVEVKETVKPTVDMNGVAIGEAESEEMPIITIEADSDEMLMEQKPEQKSEIATEANTQPIQNTMDETAQSNVESDADINQVTVVNTQNNSVQKLETQNVQRRELTRNVNTEDIIKQIAERIKVEVRNDTSEIRLTLRPEHLGDVTLKVTTQNGIVTAQFIAESQRVKEIIESNFNQLKESLSEQGIDINGLSVSVGQEDNLAQREQAMELLRNNRNARRSARINAVDGIEAIDAIEAIENSSYIADGEIVASNIDYKI